jgi:hypothetical protein
VQLKERLAAERRGQPFLLYRDGHGAQRIVELNGGSGRISLGRSAGADVSLDWDSDASRAHAELQQIADVWTVIDDGLSRNGTYVNGERIQGRRRLADGDSLRCGNTLIRFSDPADTGRVRTAAAVDAGPLQISQAQRRVLVALVRPFLNGNPFATAASNPQIAGDLHLSIDAVKSHVRGLFQKFGVEDLPQNQKRARLAELALQRGEVTERDLDPSTLH